MNESLTDSEEPARSGQREDTAHQAESLEDGSLDPDELTDEPDWWDEGSDDEA
jgi:hypothetical protein